MRATWAAAIAMCLGAWSAEAQDALPAPDVERVDHADPAKYLALPESIGKRTTLEALAREIDGEGARAKLTAIGAWITTRLRYDEQAAYRWRDVDAMLADGTYGGCADHALLFGALARACGIPTVWVKTMDVEWIRAFRSDGDESRTWSGHVFLEVHLDGRWALLDATHGVLYDEYDVGQRLLPGDRLAYDKGGDPYELLLSTRWDPWKEQTRRFFRTFDLARLPVGRGSRLASTQAIRVAANNPEYDWIAARCAALGRTDVGGGNGDFDAWLPAARAGVLVVACRSGQVVLPEAHRGLLPAGWEQTARERGAGVLEGHATDGTRVVVVFGTDDESLRAAVQGLTLP